MAKQITLTQSSINGGTPVRILAPTVVIGGQKNNSSQPHTSSQDRVEVQTQSRNNVTITLQQVKLIPGVNRLTWADIWKLYTQQYIGSNAATLNITYEDASDGSDESLFVISDSSAQTQETAIKVVLKSFTFNFNAQDSRNANQPTGTLVFEETA